MSLQLYIGHSGQSLAVDTTRITTLEALRAFVAARADIQPQRQVLLTIKGKSVRPQTLLTEEELYVFDSSLLSSASSADLSRNAVHVDLPALLDAGNPPDTIVNHTDLQSWQTLFHKRLDWAKRHREQCASLSVLAQQSLVQQQVIQRGLGVALDSLQLHLKSAEQKQTAASSWADELLADQERRMNTWERDSGILHSISARADFARFVQYNQASMQGPQETSLETFLPYEQVQTAANQASRAMTDFKRRLAGMRTTLAGAKEQSEELMNAAEQMHDTSSMEASMEPDKLMEEIDILLRKITSDDNHVSSLQRTTQSASQASKMALLHTRNYLPNLQEYASEMNDLVRKNVDKRNNTAKICMQHMQTLSRIESHLSKVLADVKALDVTQEDQQAFNTLNIASRLPYVYGSLLIEAVRRREWAEKMKKDSSTLAEEMATYQEEESRRRQRWLNSIDDVIQPELVKSKAFGIEVNLQSELDQWPSVVRQEIEEYIASLTTLPIAEEVTRELTLAMRTLDQPTRKQIKHAKAFRAGSVHEAAFGTTSLALRGDDEFKVLRDANTKLEEELRGQKSRVRKLEDLLHRQTALNRVVSGDVFTPQMELVSRADSPSPSPSPGIRRVSEDFRPGSARSRRTSSNQGGEEKRLARRVVMLEAELQSQKEVNASLEKDAAERSQAHETGRLKMEEAESIKKDIMSNMEAQGREFATERRGLEQELAHVRARVEELEDELDRILGSRDQERGGADARTRALEEEITRARSDYDNVQKERTKNVEDMRQKWLAEQDRSAVLENQLRDIMAAKETVERKLRTTQARLDEHQSAERDNMASLTAAHLHLDTTSPVPEAYTALVSALEDLARRSALHARDLAEAVEMAKSENESLLSQHQARTSEMTEVRTQCDELEAELARAKEKSAAASAKANSLASQLDDEREQLRSLRRKFAEGETGADALRHRVDEQEEQVGRLLEQLAESKSHVNSLDVELMRIQTKHNAAETAANAAKARLDIRSARAKEMTIRLFAQNARLMRLLETLGFAVSHKDGQMFIERASKVAGASTTLTEPSQILSRAVSYSSPPGRKVSDPASEPDYSLSFLHWMDLANQSAEDSAWDQLLSNLSLFSTDVFSDAIAKRLRDFEYTARKFRLESRNASAKATRFSQDASQKLAVRDFKEGDLALFLPTKGKAVGAWAAFNINAPHHFLRERENMSLGKREWLVARITKVEERVVDLSRSMRSTKAEDGGDRRSLLSGHGEGSGEATTDKDSILENDNPFELSDGLTWYLVHATEERGGAPIAPSAGKVTVQASVANANAERSNARRLGDGDLESPGVRDLKEKLGKSLSSRRSSSTSKRSVTAGSVKGVPITAPGIISPQPVNDTGRSPSSTNLSPPGSAVQSGPSSLLTAGLGLLSPRSVSDGRLALGSGGDSGGKGSSAAQERDKARHSSLALVPPTITDKVTASLPSLPRTPAKHPQPLATDRDRGAGRVPASAPPKQRAAPGQQNHITPTKHGKQRSASTARAEGRRREEEYRHGEGKREDAWAEDRGEEGRWKRLWSLDYGH
ncbi:hypothetical protein K461DRAFT_266856 [Myriangium duriaei CBS 260.36]|uniref:Autophagy-related protein 11 n=1 Tax=Myriangium duriaei CBS 260.36 TaxID=1168546 RepID=A0A9P4MHZ5_9PEZI|nr:hypothetical protein K461DRAFT_266856 [Myriangium duriaei CBS 260.36]